MNRRERKKIQIFTIPAIYAIQGKYGMQVIICYTYNKSSVYLYIMLHLLESLSLFKLRLLLRQIKKRNCQKEISVIGTLITNMAVIVKC